MTFSFVLSAGGMHRTLFLLPIPCFFPGPLKVAVRFLVSWCLVGYNLLQLCAHTVIFSSSSLLFILSLERVVQVGSRVPACFRSTKQIKTNQHIDGGEGEGSISNGHGSN